ncbi:MAG: DNA repair protein RadA [Candidatus Pacebacteria bacterium]|nr:DNA repair protein RadA [Candidatus Paceibacterota bacterium]
MAKSKTVFVCQKCGADYPKWQGQCAECGQWNTLVEELSSAPQPKGQKSFKKGQLDQFVTSLPEVEAASSSKTRFSSSIGELDRVLGGGLVPGAVILLGGEPGIGKSTLLTQMVLGLAGNGSTEVKSKAVSKGAQKKQTAAAKQNKQQSESNSASVSKNRAVQAPEGILYVSGEESPSQINLRINRIINNEQFLLTAGFGKKSGQVLGKIQERLHFFTSTNVDQLTSYLAQSQPGLVIVDSIQSLSTEDLTGASGSVGQVRESTDRIISAVKARQIPTFLVGHVTKEGVIAGPKVLEHMVDTVLELSGERTGQFRMLRALKNRFGATDEVGVFKFVDYGLEEVTNPSELFVNSDHLLVPGSAVVCTIEGTRPLLVEVQALVNHTQLAMPRRVGRGIELSRIQVLAAVLQKHCSLPLGQQDIFLSAAGGFSLKEPAIDLGLAVAISSSLKNKKLPKKSIFIGEVGLLGEVRPVSYLERRVKEAKRLGFEQIISAETHRTVRQVLSQFKLLAK